MKLNKEGMKRMKKFFPAFMAFLLVFSTVGPLPGVAEGFPGAINIVDKNNIKVDMVDGNFAWKITLHKKNTGNLVAELSEENTYSIKVTPGLYEVRAERIGSDPKFTEIYSGIEIKPRHIPINDITTDIYKIIVQNVIPGSEVNLYKSDSPTPYKTQKPNAENIVIFDKVDANDRYSVTHFIDGADSTPSGNITVYPAAVKLDSVKNSGSTNNLGEIRVSGTKNDNELVLYRAEQSNDTFDEDQQIISKGSTANFTKLKAGFYRVIQKENGVESKLSNIVEIINEQKPIIELEGPHRIEIFHNENEQNKYKENGYKVIDKNGKSTTSKVPLSCTDDNELKISVSMRYKDRYIDTDQQPTPGIYTLIYTATDCNNEKLFSTETREITVYPKKIDIIGTVNTKENKEALPIKQQLYGSITVKNIFNNAGLYLYQDLSETNDLSKAKLIRKITNLNENTYTFLDVPVGKGYFVFQEVEGVKSKFSDRVEIKDTTSPDIILHPNKDGATNLDLEVGDTFSDPGFTAIDNIGIAEEVVTYDPSPVNTNLPGKYTIFYNAKDTAGLSAIEQRRTVTVRPKPVIAIGSTAAVGEIGVSNIFPGTQTNKTTLKLYKANNDGVFPENIDDFLKEFELDAGQTTYVFKNIEPGRYLVIQEVNSQVSRQSNVVEIADIDKPYIALNGPEEIKLIWHEEKLPIYKKTMSKPNTKYSFFDLGAVGSDYLLSKDKPLILTSTLYLPNGDVLKPTGPVYIDKSYGVKENIDIEILENGEKHLIKPNGNIVKKDTVGKEVIVRTPHDNTWKENDSQSINIVRKGTDIAFSPIVLPEPGKYKMKYTAKAIRGAEAQPKYRTITVEPRKINQLSSTPGTSIVTATVDTYKNLSTTVKLYNSYNQLLDTHTIICDCSTAIATFNAVPAGIGYYVTQTVNGIESQPSLPVNVSIFEDAKPTALITSFNFEEVDAINVIDHKAGEIRVTVPKTANLKSLTPVITSIGTITPDPQRVTDFSDSKTKLYSVVNSAGNTTTTKTYSVTVKHAVNSSAGSMPLEKDGVLTPLSPSVSLSPTEMDMAKEHGVTFITKDKKVEAHVPSSNVIESGHSTFTLKQSFVGESYEVSFGNLSRFMQPIELKLPKSETKVLAKLIDGYTVAVPSATTSTSTIGLVDEPGTYALVDSVSAPRINPTATGSATYTLQLARLETAGTIYYTTSSKDISFTTSPQSTNAQLKNKYVATASPADILKWTKYTPNDKISTPTGELYAVVVNGNQISQITALDAASPVDWSKNIPSYDTHKVLNINFNARVDREALYSGLIYVIDDATNEKVATTLQMSGDGKTIYVVPQKAYTRGKQYTLHIDRQFKGNTKNKEFLKKSLLQTFKIN
ncbi:hypothetical protein CSV63_13865 [Sporosarcina sp. P34]|uniref:immunoglobulin-like domain-containing protein n=1 Tax=Sporosarcina sp. P34 TaxID=2048247 RepID=UPI000C168451|nr:immunoglobulin-like domain-containing protein [Sporosarcina sp. P34]PID14172.1 hypothetical protein CSV63_13865 [Sporosarcina sp. P34]